jgi:polo-like kinase 1
MNTASDKDKQGEINTENQTIVEEKIVKVTGDIQIRKYIKGRLLGKGGFAKCYEFTCVDTKRISAAKVVVKSSLVKSRAKQKLISEIKIHKALHNTNIVGFEHYFEDTDNVYILLEMCTNQSLNELIKRRKTLTEIEVQCYTIQLIKALKYLHSHRIIHRDLKLGNLFLTDKMELKVGDFGLATKLEFEGERKRTVCGTPNYIAPEILDGKCGHSYEVDIWSLGVIIYTLIIGKPPFETQDVKTTYKRIKMNSYTFPERAVISDAAKSLITDILTTDPTKRPSLDGMIASDFFALGTSIPKLLPTSTLACPPSLSYIRQFMPEAGSNGIVQRQISSSNRMGETKDSLSNKVITDRDKGDYFFFFC